MAEESEFGWGGGLAPPSLRGAQRSAYDQLRATRMTDPANPEASEDEVYSPNVTKSHQDKDGRYVAGHLRSGVTAPVTETAPSSTSGQHKRVDPLTYNPGHDPEGEQDGAGAAWRATLPPNPVT